MSLYLHKKNYWVFKATLQKTCQEGDLEAVKSLVNSSDFPLKDWFDLQHYEPLLWASQDGHVHIIEYFLDLIMENFKDVPNLHNQLEQIFSNMSWQATLNNQKEVVKLLLTSPNLEKKNIPHLDVDWNNGSILCVSLNSGHIDIARFVLTDPAMMKYQKKYANIHIDNDDPFKAALEHAQKGTDKSIHFLICEAHIALTPEIEKIIEDKPEIKALFEKRNLQDKLFTTLPTTPSSPKVKI